MTMMVFEGDEELVRAMHAAQERLRDMTAQYAFTGKVIVAAARRKAPKQTGRLAGSLRAAPEGQQVQVGSPLVYAPVIHYGWPAHNIEPQPFLDEAAEETQDEWMREFIRELDAIVEMMGAST